MPTPNTPDLPTILSALGRAGYGARADDVAAVSRQGFGAWVETQLRPDADDDCHDRLRRTMLRIRYGASDKWPAVDEMRPLGLVDRPIEDTWPLYVNRALMDGAERRRPRDEVTAATILRAVHSHWQVREVLVGFWHDHFNVDAVGAEPVSIALPTYDRDVIRRHCLGNFRAFLEAVATSTAMQFYLSNRSSRAGSANENYARELFELHTLGRAAYLNDRYDRWRDVPGASTGAPTGYIDQDVYEAARAFTGWTIEDGSGIDGKRKLPDTGRFAYVETWHDGYQKRVLAREFDPFRAALQDGRHVLDLVADHPATARHLATKLCRRFLGDAPPERVIVSAMQAWTKHRAAPDQIAQVVRSILLAPEFLAQRGAKVRRPLAMVAAFARATGLDLVPTEALANEMAGASQRLFGWPTPTGLPDTRHDFLTANAMRRRWGLMLGLAENAWGTGVLPVPDAIRLPTVPAADIARHFLDAMTGRSDDGTVAAVLGGLGWAPDRPIAAPGTPDAERRTVRLAGVCAMTPAFQAA